MLQLSSHLNGLCITSDELQESVGLSGNRESPSNSRLSGLSKGAEAGAGISPFCLSVIARLARGCRGGGMGKDQGAIGSTRDSRTEDGLRMGGYLTLSRGLMKSVGRGASVSHESSTLRSTVAIGLIVWSELQL